MTLQQPVDETNLQVQLLLDAEMGTPEQCVRAIEMHGTAHEAMDHMMEIQIEEDDGFFQGGVSIPTEPVLEEPSLPSQHVTRSVYISYIFPYLQCLVFGTFKQSGTNKHILKGC